jgi:hypothetical protein
MMPMAGAPTPFIRPGIKQPPTKPADQVALDPDAEVIGVSVGDTHRAYVSAAMSSQETHVINDVVGGAPVTVAFCDRTRCARAFTSRERTEPLDVQLGGWSGEQLWLLIDGRMLPLSSDEIPLERMTIEKCTWGEWKVNHPDTDVFVGLRTPAVKSTPPSSAAP